MVSNLKQEYFWLRKHSKSKYQIQKLLFFFWSCLETSFLSLGTMVLGAVQILERTWQTLQSHLLNCLHYMNLDYGKTQIFQLSITSLRCPNMCSSLWVQIEIEDSTAFVPHFCPAKPGTDAACHNLVCFHSHPYARLNHSLYLKGLPNTVFLSPQCPNSLLG